MNIPGLDTVIEKIDSVSKRERILMFAALVITIILAWWQFFVIPMQADQVKLAKNKKDLALKVQLLEIELGGFTEFALQAKIIRVRTLNTKKISELEAIDEKIDLLGAQVVSSNDVNEKVLQRLLEQTEGLRLVNWDNAGVEALFDSKQAEPATNKKNKIKVTKLKTPAEQEADDIALNQDMMVIKFEGGYFDFLRYLDGIEKMNWQLFWKSLDYQVIEYPNALITLRVGIPNIKAGEHA